MSTSLSDTDRKEHLDALDDRIKALKGEETQKHHSEEHYSQAQHAWRMVVELVAGLGIGFGIGYGLDALFGTTPILMVLFIFLGFAAGVKTMMRSAQEIQELQLSKDSKDGEETRNGN